MSYRIVLAPDALGGNVLLSRGKELPVSWALWHKEGRSYSNEHGDETLKEEDIAPARRWS
jgi:hypothetical protein